MQEATLKNIIIQKISEINDISFLEAVNKILDVKKEAKVLILDKKIKQEIHESQKDIDKALFIENETLNKEINSWLQEK